MSNRNIVYAEILVDELARAGLSTVCIAPGSRHTPLVMAFANHPDIKVYSHLDERSAAFFALGIGLATGMPSAVVCTSGTAVANFFPAVIEATQSNIPLLVISADRPPELRDSGANQTIDQIKIFGDYPLWAVDLPVPEETPSALMVRYLRSTASRAIATTIGIRKGAVHLNVPFRKPLEPIPVPTDTLTIPTGALAKPDRQPYARHDVGVAHVDDEIVHRLSELLISTPNILFVCGTACPPSLLKVLKKAQHNITILTDSASGIRFGLKHGISAYDTFLNMPHNLPMPDVVVRFGYVPTSNWLNVYLDSITPHTRIHIHENGVWADDSHRTDWFIQADPADLLRRVLDLSADKSSTAFYSAWQTMERNTWKALSAELDTTWFDGAIVHRAVNQLPEGAVLFVGNSLPIRHLDQFGRGVDKPLHAYGIRGASGIDGNISVALGLGAGHGDAPLCAIVGDITAYHDMNGLLAVHRCGVPMTLVVINNDGGGIFHRLPISQFDPTFTDYFLTPHGLNFAPVAQLYGLEYANPQTFEAFDVVFTASLAGKKSTLIEIKTSSADDFATRKALLERVKGG
jgi:2-succinyl-5-enolpyruvyl-6-hydroxy-3-cyclohexene-1-carboxylate synthase